jgi:hypothetical protein
MTSRRTTSEMMLAMGGKWILVLDYQAAVAEAITAILEIDGHAIESVGSAFANLGRPEYAHTDATRVG